MPVYQYACTECGEQLEVRQTFTEASLTECPACEGRLRKVLNAVGVVFKGSGFYRNDSREAAKAGAGSANGGSASAKSAESASGSDGSAKKESTPAATGGSDRRSPGKPGSGGSSGGAKPAPAPAH